MQSNIMVIPTNSDIIKNFGDNLIPRETTYENVIKKLELEKSHLTVTVHSLNEKYKSEIMILDESYK